MRYAFGELKNGGIRICKCGEATLEDEMHLCPLTEEPVTEDPMTKIEDTKAWKDFGKQGYLILTGAIEEGASLAEAIVVLQGFYAGMFRGTIQPDTSHDDDEVSGN